MDTKVNKTNTYPQGAYVLVEGPALTLKKKVTEKK